MKIDTLIDRNFTTASILEDTRDVFIYLNENDYIAVIDEEEQLTGIVTLKDLNRQPDSRALIDCNIDKPKVLQEQTIFEVFSIMEKTGYDFLPVYEEQQFIGVISLVSVTSGFAQALDESKKDAQKVYHDLRNPLSNLHGLLQILTTSITDPENQELIKYCNQSCKHAIDTVDDLLYMVVDENRPLQIEATNMNAFYQECVKEQSGLSHAKNIRIEPTFTPHEIVKEIDRVQFKRAVQNVIGNAIKFSHLNSTIKISTKIEDDKIILKVLDAGIGIPENFQPEIFKRFTSAGRQGTNGEPTTGLGLCFSKQCIEQHGGSIYFKSTEGKGTKFYISV